jgi:prepilin-type N-terminal cleavage/methylation domain-containing protein
MTHPAQTVRNRGFLLLEMVLALAVFSIAATAFIVALNQMGKAASLAQAELKITRILDSALDETLSLPTLEEGETTATVGEAGNEIDIKTTIKLMDDLQNEDGQPLNEMYDITVAARWYESGEWKDRSVETWRNGRMYQPP